jgi:two-component system, chemotaxis family, chemotaxis protein CheY
MTRASNILVVDDNAAVRKAVMMMLEMAGHHVAGAKDGAEAMRAFEAQNPDLVIVDIIMPDKDGIEIIREMRRIRPDARIIAMTGGGRFPNLDFLKMAREFGAADAVAKPIDPDDLAARVEACLGA